MSFAAIETFNGRQHLGFDPLHCLRASHLPVPFDQVSNVSAGVVVASRLKAMFQVGSESGRQFDSQACTHIEPILRKKKPGVNFQNTALVLEAALSPSFPRLVYT
jgi:hypothetical protein